MTISLNLVKLDNLKFCCIKGSNKVNNLLVIGFTKVLKRVPNIQEAGKWFEYELIIDRFLTLIHHKIYIFRDGDNLFVLK